MECRDWRLPAQQRAGSLLLLPLLSTLSAGSAAWASVLVKCTVPPYAVAVLLNASRAVTVKLNEAPAVADAPALTAKYVAAAGLIAIGRLVPVTVLVLVSVA